MCIRPLTMFCNYFNRIYLIPLLFDFMRVKSKEKEVVLTFDYGPEKGITEFVLEKLKGPRIGDFFQ